MKRKPATEEAITDGMNPRGLVRARADGWEAISASGMELGRFTTLAEARAAIFGAAKETEAA